MDCKKILLIALLVLGQHAPGVAANAAPVSTEESWLKFGSYVTQVYRIDQAGIEGTLRFVNQLPDGCLLVGSTLGAYLYDGSRWSQIPGVPSANSILRTARGEILIGSYGLVFELKKNEKNAYEAKRRLKVNGMENIVDFMDEDSSGRLIGCYGNGIFYEDKSSGVKTVPIASWLKGIACLPSGNILSVNLGAHHLGRLTPDFAGETNIEGSFRAILGDHHITEVKQRNRTSCWAISDDGRIFIYDGQKLIPTAWEAKNPDLRVTPRCILEMDNGDVLVGTTQEGLYLFNAHGEIAAHMDLANGLPEDTVVSATIDRDGGLWVATPRYVLRLDAKLRFRDFGASQGLKMQNCVVITRHRGRLYVAGQEGLFVQDLSAKSSTDAFKRVPGVTVAMALVSDGETLWVADHDLTAIHGDAAPVTYDAPGMSSIFVPPDRKDLVICGTTTGFVIVRKKNGVWSVDQKIPTKERPVYGMGELQPNEYWAQLGTGKVARLREKEGRWDVQFFGTNEGIPNRWIDLGLVDHRLIVPADMKFGAMEWDETKERFVPTDEFTYYTDYSVHLGALVYHPTFFTRTGEMLVRDNARLAHLVRRLPPIALSAVQVVAGSREECALGSYQDYDGATWVCHSGGVLRCAGPYDDPVPTTESLVIRLVEDMHDNSLLAANLHSGSSIDLAARHNWLRISIALVEYRSDKFSQFHIWLEGFEPKPAALVGIPDWEPKESNDHLSNVTEREFTNLPSGKYTLHVEAMDGMGMRRQELVVPLEIRTPWYALWTMKMGYGLALLGAVFGFVRLRERGLKRRNQTLEATVASRTEELRGEKQGLQQALVHVEKLAGDARESEQRFRRMANNAPVMIWMSDAAGRWIFANDTWKQYTGKDATELLGEGWTASIHPEDRAKVSTLYAEAHRNRTAITSEYRLLNADGGFSWVRMLARPLREDADGPNGLIGTCDDVTAIRQAQDERLNLERALQQTQRLESLGVLAGGIAHDFNNLLTGIMGNASLLRSDVGHAPDANRMLSVILDSSKKAAELCRQMLAYAGTGLHQVQPIDLSDLVERTLGILRSQMGKDITFELDLPRGLPRVVADAPQLHQLFTNLLTNAIEAIGKNPGTITIRTFRVTELQRAPGQLLLAPAQCAPSLVGLEISDNGPGIPPENLERIFEPFFTTKTMGRGLGLSAVHGIVKGHQGLLRLKNEPGKGCTFWLAFPGETTTSTPSLPPPNNDNWKGSGRVLLVDDEPAVRDSVRRMLVELGFDCVEAGGGLEALELHAKLPPFDLVVLDLVMPICDGSAVMAELNRREPGLRILLISGFNVMGQSETSPTRKLTAFLQKPFDMDGFKSALKNILKVG
ncbi:MAG: ATP-binding protein [Lacunisphaera sp.]